MKALFFADSHTFHEGLIIPKVDMVIFGGDCSNPGDVIMNTPQVIAFLDWYSKLPIKYKLFVPGNHDTSIERGLVHLDMWPSITCLNHQAVTIEGIRFFGSPYTPSFGIGWAYNVPRGKLKPYWNEIPEGIDVLITHGPPQGILDLAYDFSTGAKEQVGDKALMNRVNEIKPRYHLFGHIHENGDCNNKGIYTRNESSTIFINGSLVTDRKFALGLTSQGIIIDLSPSKGSL